MCFRFIALFFAICLASPTLTFAAPTRVLTLYPENDIHFRDGPLAERGVFQLHQTTVLLGVTNCTLLLSHTPFLYQTLQIGAGCSLPTGRRNNLGLDLLVEAAYRQGKGGKKAVRPGALPALRHVFHLVDGPDLRILTFASLAYKVVARDSADSQTRFARPGYNPFYIQRWADVLESNYAFGVLMFLPFSDVPEGLAVRAHYLETLPLAVRRWGSLADSASVQYKQLEANARIRLGDFLLGAGVGYAILTFDSLRVGVPLPSLNFGFFW